MERKPSSRITTTGSILFSFCTQRNRDTSHQKTSSAEQTCLLHQQGTGYSCQMLTALHSDICNSHTGDAALDSNIAVWDRHKYRVQGSLHLLMVIQPLGKASPSFLPILILSEGVTADTQFLLPRYVFTA